MNNEEVVVKLREQIGILQQKKKGDIEKGQKEAIDIQIRMKELAIVSAETTKESKFDDGVMTPAGIYVSECVRVHVKEGESKDGKPQIKVGLIMQPNKRITFEGDDEVLTVTDVTDEKLAQHWISFNQLVGSIYNEEASTKSGISRIFQHLSVDVKQVGAINPALLDPSKLKGLRVIEQITNEKEKGGERVFVNSSVGSLNGTNYLNRGYGKEAKAVKAHNKPILTDFLETELYLGLEAVPYLNV